MIWIYKSTGVLIVYSVDLYNFWLKTAKITYLYFPIVHGHNRTGRPQLMHGREATTVNVSRLFWYLLSYKKLLTPAVVWWFSLLIMAFRRHCFFGRGTVSEVSKLGKVVDFLVKISWRTLVAAFLKVLSSEKYFLSCFTISYNTTVSTCKMSLCGAP